MTKKERAAAKSLAVAYQALHEALDISPQTVASKTSASVWAGMLFTAQLNTGIELFDPAYLTVLINPKG